MGVVPMFPLGSPLLPGAVLPLHVFEDRYRTMLRDILADDANPMEFGVTMIERGGEVGGGDQRAVVGTVARIVDAHVTDDGRYALVTAGTERLRVNAWLPDDPYPIADVDLWPDEGEHPDDVVVRVDRLRGRVHELNAVVRGMGGETPPADTEISSDPRLAVYHLGVLAPIGPSDRHRMLVAPGLAGRIEVLEAALDDAAAVLEFRRS
jgi:Lon protease-like protein